MHKIGKTIPTNKLCANAATPAKRAGRRCRVQYQWALSWLIAVCRLGKA